MNIKVPLPRQPSAFAFRRGKLRAFYAGPGFSFSGRGQNLGAFYMSAPRPPLPARSVFRKLAAFYMNAPTPPLPAASVFGAMRRLRGMGQEIPIDYSPVNSGYITLLPASSDASLVPPSQLQIPLIPADSGGTLTAPDNYVTPGPYNPASTNPALDAFNAALANSPASANLTAAQIQQLSKSAGSATPTQLAAATAQLSSMAPGTSAPTITQSLTTWLAGKQTIGGYSVSNSTLLFGGSALAIGLVILNQMGGGKKRRR